MTASKRCFPALPLILALSALLNLTGIWWGLPTNHSWAPDEIFPGRVLDGLKVGFADGWYDRYPPAHFFLLSVLYAPVRAVGRAAGRSPASLDTLLFFLGRFLNVLLAAGCLVLIHKIGRQILDRRAALFAVLITALLVPFPFYAKTAHLDIPYLFWFLWSLYFFVRIVKSRRPRDYLLFALTAVWSVCTKDQAYGLYVLAPVLVVWADRRAERAADPKGVPRPFLRSLFRPRYLGMAGLGAGTFLLGHNLPLNVSGFIAHVRLLLGHASQDFRMYPATVPGELRLLGLTVKEIGFCLGWPLLLICLLGLGLALRERPKNFGLLALPIFGLSYYVFYIGVIGYNYDRFNLPLCVLLSFFGGKAISGLLSLRPPRPALVKAAATLAFAYTFLLAASVDVLMVKDSRYQVERWLHAHVPGGTRIGFVGLPNYLPRLDGFARRSIDPNLETFRAIVKPEFLVINRSLASRYPAETRESGFYGEFTTADPGYEPAYNYQTPLGLLPLHPDPATSNLAMINPAIEVYRQRSN